MSDKNYQRAITVDAPPEDVYLALTTGYEHWWTTPDKPIQKVGDVSKFGFSGKHGYWTFKATVLTPERVELVCVDALHLLEGEPKEVETEWLDTKVIWEIVQRSEKTIIRFEHDGLNPNLLCYDICEAGWDLFFVDSLKAYLDTGIVKPFQAG